MGASAAADSISDPALDWPAPYRALPFCSLLHCLTASHHSHLLGLRIRQHLTVIRRLRALARRLAQQVNLGRALLLAVL